MITDLKHNSVYIKTKTYSYLYPMISKTIPGNSKKYLVNVFLGDVEYPELNNHFFLLYRFSGEMAFTYFEDDFEKGSSFVKSYDPDRYHVMKIINVEKDMKYNYDTFKNSKYSQLTDPYKKQIIEHWDLKEDHPITGVLYKKEFVYLAMEDKINASIDREQEASSVLNMEKEVYNPSFKVYDAIKDFADRQTNGLK